MLFVTYTIGNDVWVTTSKEELECRKEMMMIDVDPDDCDRKEFESNGFIIRASVQMRVIP